MISKAFDVYAYAQKPISDVRWENIHIEADASGIIANAKDWTMQNVTILTRAGEPVALDNCDHVQVPKVKKFIENY